MKKPAIPENELQRLSTLQDLRILDSAEEQEYDDITRVAAQICGTPISLISLIDEDRQWFKSHHGLAARETPRDHAFCAHAINDQEHVLIVPDSRIDERFHDNPLVTDNPNVIFYTGVPLITQTGYALGTLCVIDHQPKTLSSDQIDALKSLSHQIIKLFELRINKQQLEQANNSLQQKNIDLEQFAHIAAHDLKSPLNNMVSVIDLILAMYTDKLDDQGRELLDILQGSSQRLRMLVDGILKHSKSDIMLTENKEHFVLNDFIHEVIQLLNTQNNITFKLPEQPYTLYSNRIALEQIFINLLSNAIRYNDKEIPIITVTFHSTPAEYLFKIADNGPGIEPRFHQSVFELFTIISTQDRFSQRGSGIGLSTVKKLIEGLGGTITLNSTPGNGTTFSFNIPR